jgi:hypothetical protein
VGVLEQTFLTFADFFLPLSNSFQSSVLRRRKANTAAFIEDVNGHVRVTALAISLRSYSAPGAQMTVRAMGTLVAPDEIAGCYDAKKPCCLTSDNTTFVYVMPHSMMI